METINQIRLIFKDWRIKDLKFIFNKKGIWKKMIYKLFYSDLNDNIPNILNE